MKGFEKRALHKHKVDLKGLKVTLQQSWYRKREGAPFSFSRDSEPCLRYSTFMHSHTLIIGGTGMLTDAAVALASTTSILTSVARTQTSLKALDAKLKDFAGTHHLVQLNWANRSHFLDSLSAHIKQVGIPSRVVAWLHDDDFGPEVARLCSSQTQPCDFFQVRGSTAADPYIEATRFTARFDSLHGVTFHQVILGFIRTTTGSRWLRNSEISAGVLRATQARDRLSIVGVVEPWEARP